MEKSTEIVVVGSTNVDMVARVAHLPLPGETIGEAEYSVAYGGKGANQAVAAAKAGGHVTFVSYLGEDVYADALLASFKEAGINTEYIRKLRGVSTGVALIFVSEAGENCIAVAPGANGLLQGDGVRVQLKSSPNAMTYWALQFAEHVEILSPVYLRDKVFTILENAYKKLLVAKIN